MIELNNSHIQQIIEVAKLTWHETYSTILSNEQLDYMLKEIYTEKSLIRQMNEGQVFFGLFDNERLIAFAAVSALEQYIHKLNKIYLLKEFQGLGLGKKMINFIIEFSKSQGAKSLALNVNRDNPAVEFYKTLGFTILKEVDIAIGPYWMNDYEMIKSI